MSGECIIIAGYETDVNERLLLSDSVSKTCCKRQYIRYKGSNYFYYDFYSHISDMKNFSYYEILSSTVLKYSKSTLIFDGVTPYLVVSHNQ